jgi:DNA-binding MarR family transcriptional regulator
MIEQKLILQLKEINQKVLSIMQKKFDEYGLTFGLIYLLMVIMNKPNTTQKELAKEMRFTEGAMSISVKKLMNLNMVEQIQSEHDGRCCMLVVTEKGKTVVEDYKHYLKRILQDIFKGFRQDEMEEMSEFLVKISGNLDQILMDLNERTS